jgi:hypothetical protein
MKLHTTATWSARDDRRIMLFWLGLFLVIVLTGFGADLKNYIHENPPVPKIVHVHAVITAIWLLILTAQVLLVESNNVKLHRKLGWFAAAWAAILSFFAAWGELSWEATNLHTPGDTPAFLSISMLGLFCFITLTLWGLLLRKNPAAHRRVIFLANISIITAGFIRIMGNFTNYNPTTPLAGLGYFYGGTLFMLLTMLVWDVWKKRLMRQFVLGCMLILCAHTVSILLYYNKGWEGMTRGWMEAWAKFAL